MNENMTVRADSGARPGLLARQWAVYATAHRDRRNLVVHAATAPLFVSGSAAVVLAPFLGWIGLCGLVAMLAAIALQGRTHAMEASPPAAFAGPADFVLRILAEQWVTFPRFVLTGGFGRSWRAASPR